MKRRFFAILAAFAATIAIAGTTLPAMATPKPHHTHNLNMRLINYDYLEHGNTAGGLSGFCLDDPNNSTTNGTKLQLWSCHNVAQEKWALAISPQGTGYNVTLANGMCIDDPGGSTQNGTLVQMWACLGDKAQTWVFSGFSNGEFEMVNWYGACLDLKNDNNSDGAAIQMWTCLADNSQFWQYVVP